MAESTTLINSASLRAALGGVSAMSIWRWERDPNLDFPRPVKIGGRRFWRAADVEQFIERQAAKTAKPTA